MDRPDKLPAWVPDYTASPNVQEPSDAKKLIGFIAEKPSFKHWNWIESNQSKWIEYLETKSVDEAGKLIVDSLEHSTPSEPINFLSPIKGDTNLSLKSPLVTESPAQHTVKVSGVTKIAKTIKNAVGLVSDIGSCVGSYYIKLPQRINTFYTIRVRGYNYSLNETFDIEIRGYAIFTPAATWAKVAASSRGSCGQISVVRFGVDANDYPCIILGSDSTLNYAPNFYVDCDLAWWGASEDCLSGWEMTGPHLDTDYTSMGVTISNTVNVPSNTGVIPLGTIIPVLDAYDNVLPLPSGTVYSDGFQLCDGADLVSGHLLGGGLSGKTPNLTDGRFLRGSTTSGTTGGASSVTLAIANLPSHTHPVPNHTHSNSSVVINKNQWNTNQYSHVHPQNVTNPISSGPTGRCDYDRDSNDLGFYDHGSNTDGAYVSWASANATGTAYGQGGGATTTTATGSGTAFSIEPKYLNVKYLIKVK